MKIIDFQLIQLNTDGYFILFFQKPMLCLYFLHSNINYSRFTFFCDNNENFSFFYDLFLTLVLRQ